MKNDALSKIMGRDTLAEPGHLMPLSIRSENQRQDMYDKFKSLDGRHPWRCVSRDGYVDYSARYRDGGRVAYFNFDLAKELELIPANHAQKLTRELEQIILETFALQIINEYDMAHGADPTADNSVRPNAYMATRYLQSQHKDKRGLHSGDGRAVWNGTITRRAALNTTSPAAAPARPAFRPGAARRRTGQNRRRQLGLFLRHGRAR